MLQLYQISKMKVHFSVGATEAFNIIIAHAEEHELWNLHLNIPSEMQLSSCSRSCYMDVVELINAYEFVLRREVRKRVFQNATGPWAIMNQQDGARLCAIFEV